MLGKALLWEKNNTAYDIYKNYMPYLQMSGTQYLALRRWKGFDLIKAIQLFGNNLLLFI